MTHVARRSFVGLLALAAAEVPGPGTVSTGVFRMKGGSQTGELVRFETDAAGRVTRLVFPGYYVVRQPA
jgi:hypothetical protein